jgi:hypothetical protein
MSTTVSYLGAKLSASKDPQGSLVWMLGTRERFALPRTKVERTDSRTKGYRRHVVPTSPQYFLKKYSRAWLPIPDSPPFLSMAEPIIGRDVDYKTRNVTQTLSFHDIQMETHISDRHVCINNAYIFL